MLQEQLKLQLQKVTSPSDQILALIETDEELTDDDLFTELIDTSSTLNFGVKLHLSGIEKIVTGML